MLCVPGCQRGLLANVLVCQRGLRANVPSCQRAKSLPTSHFYVPIDVPYGMPVFQAGVPACQTVCQFFNLACQRDKSVPIFQNSSYEMLREISMIYYYIKNSTFYLISLLYISYVKILQLRSKFQTAKVPCSRFIWTTNSINHRRV